ncbi:MAG: tRNA (adenosine(37)-N6)-dimethylallyltransferase MiaA [Leptolyngbyaceae cyanobacterium SL_7_1]|nr:tRNA (adenosine(37)-N6)-dimethylallyltransferase MiaA [Leptolyngbyaceae cyanobacterium SL_7_1]
MHTTHSSFVLSSSTPILIVVCGATATGKSGLAIRLAQAFNGVILNADSRQVYRGFDIGTAKPSRAELAAVPHYLIDICDPTKTFTVAEYQAQTYPIIQQLHTSAISPLPLLVGGTGLYLKSIVRGLRIPRVAPQVELRSQLQTLGQPHCYALLNQVDPAAAKRIHPHDPTRTLRALEVFYVTGQPISAQQGESPPSYPILQIGLDCQDDATDRLADRITQRTRQMIQAGFVEEVEALHQRYGKDLPLLKTLGYDEIGQYLAGAITLEQAQALTILHTRQFAKRQRTWFRADPTIEWFDADQPTLVEQVSDRIQQFMNNLPPLNQ